MGNSVIYEYLSARGFSEDVIMRLIADNSVRESIVMSIKSYEEDLRNKGFSRREALQNYIVYRKNVERQERLLAQMK